MEVTEAQSLDGTWVPINTNDDEIVVNIGDMLARLTNNKLRSTQHRVISPREESWLTPRFSAPFFLHPRSDMDLTCLDSCIYDTKPKEYRDMTAGEFLSERLIELGLKK